MVQRVSRGSETFQGIEGGFHGHFTGSRAFNYVSGGFMEFSGRFLKFHQCTGVFKEGSVNLVLFQGVSVSVK